MPKLSTDWPPQPAWMLTVKAGDVLVDRNGTARVVRKATFHKDGRLSHLTFAIKRCSWTGRAYTTMNKTDIKDRGFHPVGLSIPLTKREDKALQKAIQFWDVPTKMDCCKGKDMP